MIKKQQMQFKNLVKNAYNKRFKPKTILKPCKICNTEPEYKKVESKFGYKYNLVVCPKCNYNIVNVTKKLVCEEWNNGNIQKNGKPSAMDGRNDQRKMKNRT